MDANARAESVWYRIAGLVFREQNALAIDIIASEIRAAEYALLLEASKLVLSDAEPLEIARQLRVRAEQLMRPARQRHQT